MRKLSRRIARRNVEQRVPVCVDSVSDSKGREIENKKRPLPLQEGGGGGSGALLARIQNRKAEAEER